MLLHKTTDKMLLVIINAERDDFLNVSVRTE